MSISIVRDAKDTMSNAKEATASARTLMDNLDKRTDEHHDWRQQDDRDRDATDRHCRPRRSPTSLHNPQRFLFGGSSGSSQQRRRR